MTILLVDDDEDDRDIFREAVSLVKPDCKLLFANDGDQGLRMLQDDSFSPDYIFLDLNMPKINGREFLIQLKADPRRGKTPVIIYSTSNHKSEMGEYFRLGATNYITKPSEFSLLLTFLKSILR